jgi:hypothetical protein
VRTIFAVAIGSHLLPAAAFLATKHRTRPGALVVGGIMVSFAANLVGRYLAATQGNNQVVSYISSPITAVCFLAAFALWQITDRERRWFRFAIPVFLTLWLLLVAFVEDMRDFDRLTGPLYSITCLVAGMWTMLRRAGTVEAIAIQKFDWFWVSLGLAIQGAVTAVTSPLAGALMQRGEADLMLLAWEIRGGFVILSYCLIAIGLYLRPPVPADIG